MEFVVNEWVPEYFKPDASNEEKQKLETFLNKFIVKNDKLFVRRPSAFLNKIYRYAKQYENNNKIYTEIKKYITNILLDSDKCCFVDDNDFELSDTITNKLKDGGRTVNDKYLFEAASITREKIIVTTDVKLKELMEDNDTFEIVLLDDFLSDY